MLVINKPTMAARRLIQLALLLLLSSSCAWANDGMREAERSGLRLGRQDVSLEQAVSWETIRAEPKDMTSEEQTEHARQPRQQGEIPEKRILLQQDKDIEEQQRARARTPTDEEAAQITTPPSTVYLPILQRQDNNQGQIDDLNRRLQSVQQSAQQALQSLSDASRRVSQASQQLSQSSQQLSQSSQQLSQQSQQLSASLQQATQSVQSLTQAVSSALSSGSSAFASCTSSASMALARASGELASKVGEAQAQITLANSQAQDQVQEAQGAAVSITQAALAIVGTFIGSSLLTVLVVWLILRRKRQNKERAAAPMNTGVSSYYGGGPGAEAYSAITRDVKDAMLHSPASGTTKMGSETVKSFGGSRGNDMNTRGYPPEKEGGIGVAVTRTSRVVEAGGGGGGGGGGEGGGEGGEGEGGGGDVQIGYARSIRYRERKTPKIWEAPATKKKDKPNDDMTAPRTPKYEVFPKPDQSPPATRGPQIGGNRPVRASIQPEYNLQEWLQTTTVSPFGTLERSNTTPAAAPKPQPAHQPRAAAQPSSRKRASEVKWPLQGPSSEPPSRSNSNSSRDAEAEVEAEIDEMDRLYQPGTAVTREQPRPKTVTIANSAPTAKRSVRVGVESMRGIGLPGVARKLPLRNT